jgi:hypothetical protein
MTILTFWVSRGAFGEGSTHQKREGMDRGNAGLRIGKDETIYLKNR